MKILITGVKGQLGHDVLERLQGLGIECCGVDIDEFDLTNRNQTVSYITQYAPDAVIHCAAFTAVDRAEDEQSLCHKVNTDGTMNVRVACEAIHAKLMYISTDYVFDGHGTKAFEPDDQKAPCNYYGLTKYEGEKALTGYEKLFIVRISWVFGVNGSNFVKTMLRLSETKDQISVVADQFGSPTYTFDLAVLLCDMILSEKYNTYHATNEGYCSWAEFAEFIFQCAGKPTKVNFITTEKYPTKAVRPKNSRMSKTRLDENGFARLPDWKDAVKRYVEEIK